MATLPRLLRDTVGKLVFREATVERVTELSRFRLVELAGAALRSAGYTAGDKVQLILDDGQRAYTPFAFDAARGAFSLLLYVHGGGPGSAWAARVAVGDRVQVFGPRGSLSLPDPSLPAVVVGDETTLGLARAFVEARAQEGASGPAACPLTGVFEVASLAEARPAVEALGLTRAKLVERRPDLGHFRAMDAEIRAALADAPRSRLVLAGNAKSIQATRALLKERPLAGLKQRVKAYWAPGKRGFD